MSRRNSSAPEEPQAETGSAAEADPEVEAAQVDEPVEVIDAEAPASEEAPADLDEELEESGAGEPVPDFLDDLRRLQAEFENYKKQVIRRQTEHLERAGESIVTNLLPVLDAGDRARAHGSEEAAGIATLLYDTLRKEGLESLGSQPGDAFDPNLHDAVAHEPAEEGDEGGAVLVEVLREGYSWKGRLLRPAMVRVKG